MQTNETSCRISRVSRRATRSPARTGDPPRAERGIVNIDFNDGELAIGPAPAHKVSREAFIAAARTAGLAVLHEEAFLPYQYFVVLGPQDVAR